MPETPRTRPISSSASNIATWLDDMQITRRTGVRITVPSNPVGTGASSGSSSRCCSTSVAPCHGLRIATSTASLPSAPRMAKPEAWAGV